MINFKNFFESDASIENDTHAQAWNDLRLFIHDKPEDALVLLNSFKNEELLNILGRVIDKTSWYENKDKYVEVLFKILNILKKRGQLTKEKSSSILGYLINSHRNPSDKVIPVAKFLIQNGAEIKINYKKSSIDGEILGYTTNEVNLLSRLGLIDKEKLKTDTKKIESLKNWAIQKIEKGTSIEEVEKSIKNAGWDDDIVKHIKKILKLKNLSNWIKNQIKEKKPLNFIRDTLEKSGWDEWDVGGILFYDVISEEDRKSIKKLVKYTNAEMKKGHLLESLISLIRKSGYYSDLVIQTVEDKWLNNVINLNTLYLPY